MSFKIPIDPLIKQITDEFVNLPDPINQITDEFVILNPPPPNPELVKMMQKAQESLARILANTKDTDAQTAITRGFEKAFPLTSQQSL